MDARYRDVVVIGGGQAGFAVGHHPAAQNCDTAILDALCEPSAALRARWDSPKLFTAAGYDPLPSRQVGNPILESNFTRRIDVAFFMAEAARGRRARARGAGHRRARHALRPRARQAGFQQPQEVTDHALPLSRS